jgi:hypothetical protein
MYKNITTVGKHFNKFFNYTGSYTINDDLTIDVYGDVTIKGDYNDFHELQIQFGKVFGEFNLGYTKLTTLKGYPAEVNTAWIYCELLDNLDYLPMINESAILNSIWNLDLANLLKIHELREEWKVILELGLEPGEDGCESGDYGYWEHNVIPRLIELTQKS